MHGVTQRQVQRRCDLSCLTLQISATVRQQRAAAQLADSCCAHFVCCTSAAASVRSGHTQVDSSQGPSLNCWCYAAEESLQERQRDSRFEIPSDVSLFSIQGPIRTKED